MNPLPAFREALQGLQAEIEQVETKRSRAQQQVEACTQELERLRAEYQGIESYVNRHKPQDQPDPGSTSAAESVVEPRSEHANGANSANGWQLLNRVEAVARILREADGPLSPGDIVEALEQVGRDDTMRDVAAALSHLKKKGRRAENVSRGRWVFAEDRNEPVEVQEEVWAWSTGEEDPSAVTTH